MYQRALCRWLDDVVIYVKNMLPNCSLVGLEMVYNALPLLGSGYRLNEVRAGGEALHVYTRGVDQGSGAAATWSVCRRP